MFLTEDSEFSLYSPPHFFSPFFFFFLLITAKKTHYKSPENKAAELVGNLLSPGSGV